MGHNNYAIVVEVVVVVSIRCPDGVFELLFAIQAFPGGVLNSRSKLFEIILVFFFTFEPFRFMMSLIPFLSEPLLRASSFLIILLTFCFSTSSFSGEGNDSISKHF